MKPTKILLVCPGNVIRSAFAEVLLRKYAREHDLQWIIHSAGTNRWRKDGSGSADPRAIAAAQLNHLDLSSHVPRKFNRYHFDDYDVIYAMSVSAYRAVKKFSKDPHHLQKLRNFMDILYPGEERDAPNPWYGGEERDFLRCFETIDLACRLMVHRYVA